MRPLIDEPGRRPRVSGPPPRTRGALLIAVLLSGLAGCHSNDGSGGSAFRNLGKRGDSNFAAANAAAGPH